MCVKKWNKATIAVRARFHEQAWNGFTLPRLVNGEVVTALGQRARAAVVHADNKASGVTPRIDVTASWLSAGLSLT